MKKLLAMLISLIICFGLIGQTFIMAQAASTWTINKKTFTYKSFNSSYNGVKNSPIGCWNYAQQAYNYIWGESFNSYRNENTNYLRKLSSKDLTLTEEHLKNYITGAALGSVIRVSNASYLNGNDKWGHSCVLVKKSTTGFTVITGGLGIYKNGKLSNPDYRAEMTYTWKGFVKQYSPENPYIKYIKWPNGSRTYMAPTTCNEYMMVSKQTRTYSGPSTEYSLKNSTKDYLLKNQVVHIDKKFINEYGNEFHHLSNNSINGKYRDSWLSSNHLVKAPTYSIEYLSNGSSVGVNDSKVTNMPKSGTKTKDVKYIIASEEPHLSGYIFKGWATRPKYEISKYLGGQPYTVNENLKLYAIWEKDTTVSIALM